ncbi:hypothetical protein GJV52_10825 [Neisseria brasiliensis]|uniref:ESPR-type extended signal peptide-containing protein n=1 Tax=Neisseria TaxID=482 RepID=UPI000C2710F0|nr:MULTISPECIES: ESPR-type extended signal peptide-containing protein [Neisseria]PJO77873.1 hypothetical protein CWC45_08150 [Neisseria sp. N177_16]QGL25979.1 hypothetical protein GJV52_10825 [Neisseria brasiliensis]
MNKVYKVVFNEVTRTWTAVAEISTSKGKSSKSSVAVAAAALLAMSLSAPAMAAQSKPGAQQGDLSDPKNNTIINYHYEEGLAIGHAIAKGNSQSIAIGSDSFSATDERAAKATGHGSVAIGSQVTASGDKAVAIGGTANAAAKDSVAIGAEATVGRIAKNHEALITLQKDLAAISKTSHNVSEVQAALAKARQSITSDTMLSDAQKKLFVDKINGTSEYITTETKGGGKLWDGDKGQINHEKVQGYADSAREEMAKFSISFADKNGEVGQEGIAIGKNAIASVDKAVVIGSNTNAQNQTGAVIIGSGASTAQGRGNNGYSGTRHETYHFHYNNPYTSFKKLGDGVADANNKLLASSVVAVGQKAHAEYGGVAIGDSARVESEFERGLGVAIGASATSRAGGVVVGAAAETQGINAVAVGRQAVAKGHASQAYGVASAAVGEKSLAMGHSTTSLGDRSIAIGTSTGNSTEKYDANTNWCRFYCDWL